MPAMRYCHPGDILKEWMEGLEWTVDELAYETCSHPAEIQQILDEHHGISESMSRKLSAALGTNPKFWYDLQCQYDRQRREQ